jgi:hypothetical protein
LVPGDAGVLATAKLLAPVVAPHMGEDGTPDLIAGVVQLPGGTEALLSGPLATPKELLAGSSFTTPSWDSLGNMWTVQQETSSSAPKVRIAPSGKAVLPPVAVPELANQVIQGLKISRDGTRVAMLAVSANVTQVLVGAVTADGDAIEHLYPLAPSLTSVVDFSWASSTTLDILVSGPTGAGSPTSTLWTVEVDGWAPSLAEHTVPPNAQTIAAAPGRPLIVGTSNLEIEAFENNVWHPVFNGPSFTGPGFSGSSPRYPG